MKKSILFIICCIWSLFSISQNAKVELNKKVPDYTFTEVLNGDKQPIRLHDLKGKVVIIEFWATWCAPCIPAMDKIEKLQQKYQKDLEVITVSFDQKKRLENFIKTKSTKIPVALDTLHHDIFPYKFIPHAIVLDKDLKVQGITSTDNINESIVQDLINGKNINLPLKDDFAEVKKGDIKVYKSSTDANMSIHLTGYNGVNTGRFSTSKSKKTGKEIKLEIINQPIDMIYMHLNRLNSSHRVVYANGIDKNEFSHENKENLYCLNIEIADDLGKDIFEIGLDLLNEFSDYEARKNNKEMECFVLKKINNSLKPSTAEKPMYMGRGPTLISNKMEMKWVIEYLENLTKKPVLDYTGLKEKYDINLSWQLENPKTIHDELKKYGLKLEKSEVKLPVGVLEIYRKK